MPLFDTPLPFRDETLILRSARPLGYAIYGDPNGRPVFWFHGTPGSRLQLPPDAPALARGRGFQIIGVDRPGIGLGSAAAAAAQEEEDPLDAFMRTQVAGQAEKEAERAAAHQVAWQAQYGHKDVAVSDALDEEKNMNLHCFVCKRCIQGPNVWLPFLGLDCY